MSKDKSQRSTVLDLEIPEGTRTFKTSLSLPADLAVGLNQLAKRLGISQSALVTALLSQAIPNLQKLVDVAPSGPDNPDQIKRFRGQSIDFVMDAVKKALKALG